MASRPGAWSSRLLRLCSTEEGISAVRRFPLAPRAMVLGLRSCSRMNISRAVAGQRAIPASLFLTPAASLLSPSLVLPAVPSDPSRRRPPDRRPGKVWAPEGVPKVGHLVSEPGFYVGFTKHMCGCAHVPFHFLQVYVCAYIIESLTALTALTAPPQH